MTPNDIFWTLLDNLIIPIFIQVGLLYILGVVVLWRILDTLDRHKDKKLSAHENGTKL